MSWKPLTPTLMKYESLELVCPLHLLSKRHCASELGVWRPPWAHRPSVSLPAHLRTSSWLPSSFVICLVAPSQLSAGTLRCLLWKSLIQLANEGSPTRPGASALQLIADALMWTRVFRNSSTSKCGNLLLHWETRACPLWRCELYFRAERISNLKTDSAEMSCSLGNNAVPSKVGEMY